MTSIITLRPYAMCLDPAILSLPISKELIFKKSCAPEAYGGILSAKSLKDLASEDMMSISFSLSLDTLMHLHTFPLQFNFSHPGRWTLLLW